MNDGVLRNLEEHGDQHSMPREVDFLIRFADVESRTRFRKAVEAAGYEVREEAHSEQSPELPFTLQIWLDMPVDKETIDETCLDLIDLAEACDAKFDGWETSIVKAG
jgi:regulator of RNase E activity RraB